MGHTIHKEHVVVKEFIFSARLRLSPYP